MDNVKTETIALVLGVEQAEGLVNDLVESFKAGAQSAVIMVSNNPTEQQRLGRMWAALQEGTPPDFAEMPRPDVVIFDTIYTLGVTPPPEVIQAELERAEEEDNHG